MRRFVGILIVLGVSAAVLDGRPIVRPAAVDLLDAYLRGDYATTIEALSEDEGLGDFLEQLRRDGPAWIARGDAATQLRRELTAATLALEAARAGQWREWKVRVSHPPTLFNYWRAPALLLEWGCMLMQQGHQPKAVERRWFLASVAVAERSEDYEFMVGDTKLDELADRRIYEYNGDVIQHVRHAMLRFPSEPRFNLAQAIAEEQHDPPAAIQRFTILQKDVDVRGEATVRLGMMAYLTRQDERAIDLFKQSAALSRDPWLTYLAHFVTGLIQEKRGNPADAEQSYRRALLTVPRAESGVVSLASLLFRTGRRDEAARLTEDMLVANPPVADPWRGYGDADDRFWPQLIGSLREAIGR